MLNDNEGKSLYEYSEFLRIFKIIHQTSDISKILYVSGSFLIEKQTLIDHIHFMC